MAIGREDLKGLIEAISKDASLRAQLEAALFRPPSLVDSRFEAILEEIRDLRADHQARMEQIERRMDQFDRTMAEMRHEFQAEMRRLREEFQAEMRRQHEEFQAEMRRQREEFQAGFRALDNRLIAMGARWGIYTEGAFREAMAGVIRDQFGGDVQKWRVEDAACKVRSYPSTVEVDLLIRNGRHLLLEVKSSVSDGDVEVLYRAARLYEEHVGSKPEVAIVTPAPTPKAAQAAERLGVKLYTRLSD